MSQYTDESSVAIGESIAFSTSVERLPYANRKKTYSKNIPSLVKTKQSRFYLTPQKQNKTNFLLLLKTGT